MNGTLTAPQRPLGDVTRRGFFGWLLGGVATVVLGRRVVYDFLRAETRLPGGAVVTDERLSRTFRVRNQDGSVREEMTFGAITEDEQARILDYLAKRWGVTNWRTVAKRRFS